MPKEKETEESEKETEEIEPKETKTKERYSLEEVPTQTAVIIRDNEKDFSNKFEKHRE